MPKSAIALIVGLAAMGIVIALLTSGGREPAPQPPAVTTSQPDKAAPAPAPRNAPKAVAAQPAAPKPAAAKPAPVPEPPKTPAQIAEAIKTEPFPSQAAGLPMLPGAPMGAVSAERAAVMELAKAHKAQASAGTTVEQVIPAAVRKQLQIPDGSKVTVYYGAPPSEAAVYDRVLELPASPRQNVGITYERADNGVTQSVWLSFE